MSVQQETLQADVALATEAAVAFDLQLVEALHTGGLLAEEKLRHAQRIHQKLKARKSLLQVLQELGLVDQATLLEAMRQVKVHLRLGELLLRLGYLRETDLRNALSIQRQTSPHKKLGKVLIENHFVSEDRLLDALAINLRLPRLEPNYADIPAHLLENVTPRFCRDNGFIPVGSEDGRTLVATAEPENEVVERAARQSFGMDVVLGIASSQAINEALRAFEKDLQRRKTSTSAAGSDAVGLVDRLLQEAIAARASDVHFEPFGEHMRIRFRRDGVMMPHLTLARSAADPLISRFKVLAGADVTEKRRHQDGRIVFEDPSSGQKVDLRASFFVTVHGEKLVLRVLSNKVEMLRVDELGLTPRALDTFHQEVLDTPSGIILITGPTGSGKTTTLYSCINYLNSIERSIITAEDPVEYLVEGISQCSLNPKIGLTYENTLPYIVRQDPDVIVLGEIRDNFSAEAAIQAALTGHKVLTTFHTEDTIGSLLRLMNMNIETFLISSTVVSVLAQRLLRRICDFCAEPFQVSAMELTRIGYSLADLGGATFRAGRGCEHCRYTGYAGRLGIYELLVLNEHVKNAILRDATSYEIRRVSFETSEMTTLLEEGLLKAAAGETTLAEVIRHLPRIEKPRPMNVLKRLTGVRI
ncbi:MAG: GspE/PulE family protein [Pseudomonadota bacterium]